MDSPPQSAVKLTLWLDQNQRVEQLKQEIRRVCADRFSYPDSVLELIQTRDGIIRRWVVDPAPLNPLLNSHDDTSLLAFEIVPSIADEPRVNFAVMQVILFILKLIFNLIGNFIILASTGTFGRANPMCYM